ncbi:MAG: hypothetical protein NT174_01590 [Actinobacteria bacterium]|nr:hypothetical protein [Actinomycetota bacterium]
MSPKAKSLIPAIASLTVTPFLLFCQIVGVLLASMILAEESNPMWVKILSMLVWVLIGALAVILPVWAFTTGKKSEIKASQIIGVVVGAGALVLQVYFILSFVSGGFLFL